MKRFGFKEIFLIVGLAYLVGSIMDNDRKIDRVFGNPGYSFGTVTDYLPEGAGYIGIRILVPRRSGFMDYYFCVNGQKHIGTLDGSIEEFPSEGEFLNKTFMVVYNKDDPNESQLMFDMPVSDSTDFKRYVFKLETKRRKK
jgi:hypothetical protein